MASITSVPPFDHSVFWPSTAAPASRYSRFLVSSPFLHPLPGCSGTCCPPLADLGFIDNLMLGFRLYSIWAHLLAPLLVSFRVLWFWVDFIIYFSVCVYLGYVWCSAVSPGGAFLLLTGLLARISYLERRPVWRGFTTATFSSKVSRSDSDFSIWEWTSWMAPAPLRVGRRI